MPTNGQAVGSRPANDHRFLVLDSWRGICACLVALFHFGTVSHIQDLSFLRNSYLFVDFFFVLSGFVIFASYGEKLKRGFGVGRFLFLRFGRLYPLHFAMLLAFIAADLLKLIPAFRGYSAYKPFTAPGETPPYILSNVLLIHSLGIHDSLSFNDPSWSISVEFYAYVFFAIALSLLRARIRWLLIAILLVSPAFLALFSPQYMNTTVQYGFVRCLFGFSAGALCWGIFERYSSLSASVLVFRPLWHIAEIVTLVLIVLFVTVAGSGALTLAAPVLFSITVFIFALERGIVSGLLRTRGFLLLGVLSYSLYMDHMFIKRKLFESGALVVQRLFHVSAITVVNGGERLGRSAWQGDSLSLLYVAILIGTSYITYHVIEEPCRNWFRLQVRSRSQRTRAIQAHVSVN